jgi:predicted metal-binding protein
MKPIEPKWHESIILICEKCGKKLDPKGNPSVELKDWVKKKMISAGHWGEIRVSTSSCLDICPENLVAIAFTGDRAGSKTQAFEIDPVNDREWLLEKALKRARREDE